MNQYQQETIDYMTAVIDQDGYVSAERLISQAELEYELHEDVKNADVFTGHPFNYNQWR